MKNHFLSRFDADNLRKTIIYFVIAVLLITISFPAMVSFFDRGDVNGLMMLMFFIGFAFFLCNVASLGKSELLFYPDCDFHHTFYTFTECWNWYSDKDAIR